ILRLGLEAQWLQGFHGIRRPWTVLAERPEIRLPSWSCEFDSRHPLSARNLCAVWVPGAFAFWKLELLGAGAGFGGGRDSRTRRKSPRPALDRGVNFRHPSHYKDTPSGGSAAQVSTGDASMSERDCVEQLGVRRTMRRLLVTLGIAVGALGV